MERDAYIGADMALAIGVGANTYNKKATSFGVDLPEREVTFEPLDDEGIYRRQLKGDTSINLTFLESDQTGGATFAAIGEARLRQTPVAILSWTDKETVPGSRLPVSFFDPEVGYPLSGWRFASVSMPSIAQTGFITFTAVLKPLHI